MSVSVEFVKAHPYFFANLPVLVLVAVLPHLARDRDYARAAVFSGIACMPCSLLAVTHFIGYWHPVLLGGLRYGIEDLMFTYTVGTGAWMAAMLWSREDWTVGARSSGDAVVRMLPWGLVAVADVALWMAGLNSMTATLITSTALLLFLLGRRTSLWRLALAGLVTFTPFSIMLEKIEFAVWPNLATYWNPGGPWGTLVLGVPRGEVAWSAIFGALWPVVVASALDIRFGRTVSQNLKGALPA